MKFIRRFIRWTLRASAVTGSMALSAFILIVGGYVLGWNTVSQPAPVISEDQLKISERESADIQSGFFAKPRFGADRRPGTVSSTEAEIRRRILRIASRMRPGMRKREVGAFAQVELLQFSARDLQIALDQLQDAPQNSVFHTLRMRLIARWVRLEQAAAYAYAVESMDSNSILLRNEKIEDVVLDLWASLGRVRKLEKAKDRACTNSARR